MSLNSARIPLHIGAIYAQRRGAGNRLEYIIGMDSDGMMSSYKGGGVGLPTSASFGRSSGVLSVFSNGRPVGTEVIAGRSRYIVKFSGPRLAISELRALGNDPDALKNLHVFSGSTPKLLDQFDLLTIFVHAAVIDEIVTTPILDSEGNKEDARDQLEFSVLDKIEVRQVSHLDESETVTTGALKDVVKLSSPWNNAPEREVIAVGAATTGTVPRIYYGYQWDVRPYEVANDPLVWAQQTIAACTNGTAEAVAVCGNRVVVAASGTTGGLYTARLADVKAGSATFVRAAGITSGWAFYDVIAIDEATVLAVGASGRIALSTDGGFSFSLLTSPVSSALRKVACGKDRLLAWAGGDDGVVLRIKNLLTVESLSAGAVFGRPIGALAVPYDRPNELYIGVSESGLMICTRNGYAPTPAWKVRAGWRPTVGNNKDITDITFTGTLQAVMFVLIENEDGVGVVVRDTSGGYMSESAVSIGSELPASPLNAGLNSIVAFDPNYAIVVGEVVDTYAFIGKVAAQ